MGIDTSRHCGSDLEDMLKKLANMDFLDSESHAIYFVTNWTASTIMTPDSSE